MSPSPQTEVAPLMMARALRVGAVVAVVASAVGTTLDNSLGRAAAVVALALIMVAPVVRTLSLAVRWLRIGDRRFAAVAAGVIVIIAAGTVVAALQN